MAIAKEEPAGKPLRDCQLVTVKLILSAREDRKILKDKRLSALRRREIARMCHETLDHANSTHGGHCNNIYKWTLHILLL